MSEPCREELMADFRQDMDTQCIAIFLVEFGREPTEGELDRYFEEVLESDYRVGED